MSDPKQVEEALRNMDFTDIVHAMSQLATKVITGQPVETNSYSVELKVPKEIVMVLDKVAQKAGLELEELLSHMATQGLNDSLESFKKNTTQQPVQPTQTNSSDPMEQMKSLGFDMSGLSEKLAGLQNLAEQLNSMQKVFENVSDTNAATNKKNNQ